MVSKKELEEFIKENWLTREMALEIIKRTKEGRRFLEKYNLFELTIIRLNNRDIARINDEYNGLIPTDVEEYDVFSITLRSRRISSGGYPKMRLYIEINDVDKGGLKERNEDDSRKAPLGDYSIIKEIHGEDKSETDGKSWSYRILRTLIAE
ncbi:MAG: hypothetical protein ACTSU2_12110 [Promethearchaeota archaeon]